MIKGPDDPVGESNDGRGELCNWESASATFHPREGGTLSVAAPWPGVCWSGDCSEAGLNGGAASDLIGSIMVTELGSTEALAMPLQLLPTANRQGNQLAAR